MDTKYYFTGTTIVTGFYNTEDHTTIPDGATECTREERDAACAAQSSGKILCITGGKINPQIPPTGSADWDGAKWVYNIDAIRTAKLSEITAAYIAERTTTNKGITSTALGGAVIDCRESDVLNIQNLVTLLEAREVTEYFYKLKDNSLVNCTVAHINLVLTELIAALLSMWTLKQALTEQVNAATTAEEIQAITWAWTQS